MTDEPSEPESRKEPTRKSIMRFETSRIFIHQGAPMSDLVVIVYPTEAKAEEMRHELLGLQREYLIELSDAVIAVKQDTGRVKLIQLMNTTAAGAVSGCGRQRHMSGP